MRMSAACMSDRLATARSIKRGSRQDAISIACSPPGRCEPEVRRRKRQKRHAAVGTNSRPTSKAAVISSRQTDVPYAASEPKSFTLFIAVLVVLVAISAALVAVSPKSFTCSLRTWICD
jgi:hypothetical protein